MATEKVTQMDARDAGADLSASTNLYKLAKLDANGDLVLGAASTDFIFGSIYETAASGLSVSVAVAGLVKVEAGAAINEGVPVTCNASGQAIAAGTGHAVFGYARVAAAAAGDIITVLVDRGVNAA